MRLIDADALKENFINTDANGINLAIDRYALKCIEDAPTIDAVSVVRCKECVRRKNNGFCLEHNRYEKNDNGYCNYGERSSDEQ